MESTSQHTSPERGAPAGASGLATAFDAWRRAGHRALIPYITAGHPSPAETGDLLRRLSDAGADIIEVGVPFSDPLADGPTIQRSSQRALEQGTTLPWVLDTIADFRAERDTRVVVFGYLNPVMAFGVDRFIRACASAAADGVLLTDLPLGADDEIERAFDAAGLPLIPLIAPTTLPDRARQIARRARAFLYYVSRTGVTGAGDTLRSSLATELDALRAETDRPIAVGFGISRPEHAAFVAEHADGVVVGSALINAIDLGGLAGAERFLRELRSVVP